MVKELETVPTYFPSKSFRMCHSKKRYSSDFQAAVSAGKQQFYNGVLLKVYHCPLCDGWHLTHKVRSK